MSLVRNEQTKLTASWLNAISAASIAVGGFAQMAPVFSGVAIVGSASVLGGFTAIWFAVGVGLHMLARRLLRRLEG
jgi:hypothetical protein